SSRRGSPRRAMPRPRGWCRPPVVEARLVAAPSGGRRVKIEAVSSEGLAHLRLYEDGLLIILGSHFAAELVLPANGAALGHGPSRAPARADLGAADAAARACRGCAGSPFWRPRRCRQLWR